MSGFDLAGLQAVAAADRRPTTAAPNEIPTGTSPADQAVAGYAMAVNLVSRSAEFGRLQTDRGTIDPAVIDKLNAEWTRATLNARYCSELQTIAQPGYDRLIDQYRPGASVYDILPACTVDTSIPTY